MSFRYDFDEIFSKMRADTLSFRLTRNSMGSDDNGDTEQLAEVNNQHLPRGHILNKIGEKLDSEALVKWASTCRTVLKATRELLNKRKEDLLRREVNYSLIIVNFFHKIQNFRQISDLFSQI